MISGSTYRLDVLTGMHDVYNISLLRPVSTDPFPSQHQTDPQPPAILVDGAEEYELEEIIDERVVRGRGRGGPLKRQFLCKWKGYQEYSWNDANNCEETHALDVFEQRTGRQFALVPLTLSAPKRGGTVTG